MTGTSHTQDRVCGTTYHTTSVISRVETFTTSTVTQLIRNSVSLVSTPWFFVLLYGISSLGALSFTCVGCGAVHDDCAIINVSALCVPSELPSPYIWGASPRHLTSNRCMYGDHLLIFTLRLTPWGACKLKYLFECITIRCHKLTQIYLPMLGMHTTLIWKCVHAMNA